MKIYQIHVAFHYNDNNKSFPSAIIEGRIKPNEFIKYKHYIY